MLAEYVFNDYIDENIEELEADEESEEWYDENKIELEVRKNNVYSIETKQLIVTQLPPKKYKATGNQFVYPIYTVEEINAVKQYFLNKDFDTYGHKGDILSNGKIDSIGGGYNSRIRDYVIFSIGVNIGLRISDLMRLQYKHVINIHGRFKKGFSLIEKKRRKRRDIIITDTIKNYLKFYFEHGGKRGEKIDLRKKSPDDYLFEGQKKGTHLSESQISHRLKWDFNKCIELGLIDDYRYNTQSLRKSFAWYNYIRSGKDINLVCELLQHSSVAVTMKYLNVTPDRIIDAMSTMAL